MAQITLQGRLKQINNTVTTGAKDYKSRTFFLEEIKDQYASTWSLELSGDKVSIIDTYKLGDMVDCKIDIVGKEYTKDGVLKVFNSLKCFGIYKVAGSQNNNSTQQQSITPRQIHSAIPQTPLGDCPSTVEEPQDLPF